MVRVARDGLMEEVRTDRGRKEGAICLAQESGFLAREITNV